MRRWFREKFLLGFLSGIAFSALCLGGILFVIPSQLVWDEDTDQNVIEFGGAPAPTGRLRVVKNVFLNENPVSPFEGAQVVDPKLTTLQIPFSHGRLEIIPASTDEILWKCKYSGDRPIAGAQKAGVFKIDLANTVGAKCRISVPENVRTVIRGTSGRVELEKPHFDTDIELETGRVVIQPDQSESYRFDNRVQSGKADLFASSGNSDSFAIRVKVQTGRIIRE
jgi:hypothetical protein